MTSTSKNWTALLVLVALLVTAAAGMSRASHNADPSAHPLPVIDLEQGSKAMVVVLNMTGPGSATMLDADVVFGMARGLAGEPPLLDVQIHDDKNTLAQQFNAWDPRWVEVEGTVPGEMSMLVVAEATGQFVFPFAPDLKTMTVFNSHENQPVGTYDLGPAIREFCEAHPTDPDCRTDLSISKTDGADPAVAGTDLTYTLTVTNEGSNPAHSARAIDTLPQGLTFVSGPAGCADASGVVTCELGAIPAGESRVLSITAHIDPALVYNAGGPVTIDNTATADNVAGQDTDPSDNTATEPTTVVAVADVSIASVATSAPLEVLIGEPTIATIDITTQNDGPSSPIDAVLSGTATANPGISISPATTTTNITALSVGTPQTSTQEFTVSCTQPGLKTISVQYGLQLANAADTDPDLTNNTEADSFQIDCVLPVAINIRPGGWPNSINLRTDATLAVLTTDAGEYGLPLAFDASTIQISTVRFGLKTNLFNVASPSGAQEMHDTAHIEDSYELDEKTRDGDGDAVMHFKPSDSGLSETSTEGCVKGKFVSEGTTYTFLGCDSVRIRP